MRRENWAPTKYSVLCSKHFEAEDYEPDAEFSQRRRLKKTAIPTLFNYPSYLQPKKENPRPPAKKRSQPSCEELSSDRKRLKTTKIRSHNELNYAIADQKKSQQKHDDALKKLAKYQKLLKTERKISAFRKKKCSNMRQILSKMKKKGLLDASGKQHLDVVLSPTLQILLKRIKANAQKGTSSKQYPPELQSFATTLQFYSTKAYEFVRKTFLKALPHVATVRSWFSSIHCGPGFSKQAFQLLEQKVDNQQRQGIQVFVAVTLDEMSLKKQIDYDQKASQFVGFVDIGFGVSDDSLPPATDVLAVLCVGVNQHFKILLGYFFIAGLSGAERANLVRIALQKIHETGARGLSLTCDGPSAHFAMMKELGASLDPENMRAFFNHPSDSTLRVYIFLDIVHMLKLVRNTLASEQVLFSSSGPICWQFITKLQDLQQNEGLKAGTKIAKRHIEWEKNKMKVKLAAQTLSSSVAAAIDFCREDLCLPDFQNSAPTTEFIRIFDALFDVFNSRSQFGKQFKSPLRQDNSHEWLSLFSEAFVYIQSLKRKDGTLVIHSGVKTGFVGFLCGILSMQGLFEELVANGPLSHILTYKFSQDHLELYFAAVRSKLGANNNPTCKQFTEIFKRLLVQNQIRGQNSNSEVIDSTQLLMFNDRFLNSSEVDILSSRRSDIPLEQELGEPTDMVPSTGNLSEFKESVVVYISGYVVRMVQKKLRCEDCIAALHDSAEFLTKPSHQLLRRKNWGNLVVASDDVIKICSETEKMVSNLLIQNPNGLLRNVSLSQKVSTSILKRLFHRTD